MCCQFNKKETFVSYIADVASSVFDFHQRFNVPLLEYNTYLEKNDDFKKYVIDLVKDRVLLQTEEIGELCDAVNKFKFPELADEAADVLYVAIGTILSLGNLGCIGCNNVIEKNDGKNPFEYAKSRSGKVIKENE